MNQKNWQSFYDNPKWNQEEKTILMIFTAEKAIANLFKYLKYTLKVQIKETKCRWSQ
jgi:hypothetical protein